jgi:hypothetical protein
MDSEIRAALEQIIALDEKLCGRGHATAARLASEADALLPAAGEPAVGAPDGASDPSRDILLRADPSATVVFYPLPDGTSGSLVLGLRCSWCRGAAPMPKITGLYAAVSPRLPDLYAEDEMSY